MLPHHSTKCLFIKAMVRRYHSSDNLTQTSHNKFSFFLLFFHTVLYSSHYCFLLNIHATPIPKNRDSGKHKSRCVVTIKFTMSKYFSRNSKMPQLKHLIRFVNLWNLQIFTFCFYSTIQTFPELGLQIVFSLCSLFWCLSVLSICKFSLRENITFYLVGWGAKGDLYSSKKRK